MGRQYKGLDHTKITVKLDERQFDIVRQYGLKLAEQEYAKQDLEGKYKPYNWKMSDVMRDAVDLLDRYVKMSDNMGTSAANLLDIAETFDKIEGKNASVYSQALKEAAALLLMFCYNAEWGYDGEKIVFIAKSPTKSRRGKKVVRETEVTIHSTDGLPLIKDDIEGPSEAPGARLGVGAISLPPTTIKAAREAAEAAGEELPVFVARAVETQAQRDSLTRKMEKALDKKSEA